jgi:hypothetical protein
MACCGSQRRQLDLTRPAPSLRSAVPGNPPNARPLARQFEIYFEYVGPTAITVIGGASGRRYRFDRPGDRLMVDPRDRPSLAAVPHLRQLA